MSCNSRTNKANNLSRGLSYIDIEPPVEKATTANKCTSTNYDKDLIKAEAAELKSLYKIYKKLTPKE